MTQETLNQAIADATGGNNGTLAGSPSWGTPFIPISNGALQFDGVDDAMELHESAVAHELDGPAMVPFDPRVDFGAPKRFERCQGAALILAHEVGIPHDIGR